MKLSESTTNELLKKCRITGFYATWLIENLKNLAISENSYLGSKIIRLINTEEPKNNTLAHQDKIYIENFSKDIQFIREEKPWLSKLLKDLHTSEIKQPSANISELIAFGLAHSSFKSEEIKRIKETKQKEPDFQISPKILLEVYSPSDAKNYTNSIKDSNNWVSSSHQGIEIKHQIGHPFLGINDHMRHFKTTRMSSRVVSGKRDKDQTKKNRKNILFIDLVESNEWKYKCEDSAPISTKALHSSEFLTESIGIWHAFYGEVGKTLFLPDRSSLTYGVSCRKLYQEIEYNGIFRDRKTLSAAIIRFSDGLVFLQNPWANKQNILNTSEITKCLRLYGIKIQYCWFSFKNTSLKGKVRQQISDQNSLIKGVTLDQ